MQSINTTTEANISDSIYESLKTDTENVSQVEKQNKQIGTYVFRIWTIENVTSQLLIKILNKHFDFDGFSFYQITVMGSKNNFILITILNK